MNLKGQTYLLASFASKLRHEDLPRQVVNHATLCILDTIGCGLFGSTLPWGHIMAKFAENQGGVPEAVVWGHGIRVPSANAALVNGTMVHGFELDDLHKAGIVHPGSVAVTSALAMVERKKNVSGADWLTAVVAGYEAASRVGMSVGVSHLVRGHHPTGTCGTFGAAAAAAHILGLDEMETANALGIAGTQAAGLMCAQTGPMTKRMHAGRAAQSGVYGASLASVGFTGNIDVLEAEYGGFCTTTSDEPKLDVLTDDLGERYEIVNVGFKAYASCGSTHTTIDAIKHLKKRTGLQAGDVASITVRTSKATKDHVGWEYVPESVTTAQMNLPYTVAIVLLEGDAFIDQYTEEKLRSPAVLDLTSRVRVVRDPEIDALGPRSRHKVIVEVRQRDGVVQTETVEHARGSPQCPLTPDEVTRKFRILAAKSVPRPRVQELLDIITDLEQLADVSILAAALTRG